MNRIDRIRAKLQRIEDLCVELKDELDKLNADLAVNQPKRGTKREGSLPTERECQEEFNRLYQEYLNGNSKAVGEFVDEKSKDYLRVFCKANNLLVDIKKASKDRVANEIIQRLAQRKAITGESFSS